MQTIATPGSDLPVGAVARDADLVSQAAVLAGQRDQSGFLAVAQESLPCPTKQGLGGRGSGGRGLGRGVVELVDATSHGIERSLRGIGRRRHLELLGHYLCNASIALHRD